MPVKPEVPAVVHEDWTEAADGVTSWAEEAAPPAAPVPATFGAPPAQEDWAAQVYYFTMKMFLSVISNINQCKIYKIK